ncbi:extracellular calcium-sensing receptor-like [Ambystoma mexicanum]|uniref:extracellular calcium-sensing receptor-like n=1 Tax=Ambystoma mexicanum TaxID=8296 RepID=UPI0037E834D2
MSFRVRSYRWVQGLIFAIQQINRSAGLLPNTTLGFMIHDSCGVIVRALEGTVWMLSGEEEPVINYKCHSLMPMTAVIGDASSLASIPMARLLGLHRYPQISYGATVPLLTNKNNFPSFFRTVASDDVQSLAIARLVAHFRWTWVGILADESDYGLQGSQILKKELEKAGICIAFYNTLSTVYSILKSKRITELILTSTAKVAIIFSSDDSLFPFMEDFVRNNITGMIWIASDGWSISPIFAKKDLWPTLQGTIGLVPSRGDMPGFREYLYAIHPKFSVNDIFIKEFWEEAFGCRWLVINKTSTAQYDGPAACTGSENLHEFANPFFDFLNLRTTYATYNAVYAVAYGLQDLSSCRDGHGPFVNGTCASLSKFKPWQLLHYIKHVHFRNPAGAEVFFDKNGDPPGTYDIVNWQLGSNGEAKSYTVGRFDSSFGERDQLEINDSLIFKGKDQGQRQDTPSPVFAPPAYSSEDAVSGTKQASKKAQVACKEHKECSDLQAGLRKDDEGKTRHSGDHEAIVSTNEWVGGQILLKLEGRTTSELGRMGEKALKRKDVEEEAKEWAEIMKEVESKEKEEKEGQDNLRGERELLEERDREERKMKRQRELEETAIWKAEEEKGETVANKERKEKINSSIRGVGLRTQMKTIQQPDRPNHIDGSYAIKINIRGIIHRSYKGKEDKRKRLRKLVLQNLDRLIGGCLGGQKSLFKLPKETARSMKMDSSKKDEIEKERKIEKEISLQPNKSREIIEIEPKIDECNKGRNMTEDLLQRTNDQTKEIPQVENRESTKGMQTIKKTQKTGTEVKKPNEDLAQTPQLETEQTDAEQGNEAALLLLSIYDDEIEQQLENDLVSEESVLELQLSTRKLTQKTKNDGFVTLEEKRSAIEKNNKQINSKKELFKRMIDQSEKESSIQKRKKEKTKRTVDKGIKKEHRKDKKTSRRAETIREETTGHRLMLERVIKTKDGLILNRANLMGLLAYHNYGTRRTYYIKDLFWLLEDCKNICTIPRSACSDPCKPGHRKVTQPRLPICCFNCVLCPEGEIANQSDSNECLKCPDHHWANDRRDICIPKTVEFLSFQDGLGATLATLAAVSCIFPATILLVFIKNRDTPVVKANNRELSFLLLIALTLCFLCSLIFIGQPQRITCILRQTAFGVIFAFCVSCLLAKTILVVVAFNSTKPNSSLRKWIGHWLPNLILISCTSVQVLICSVWLAISSPFPQYDVTSHTSIVTIKCNEGSTLAFWFMLGYLGLLASVSFGVAFLARKLPDSFNEATYITFSMLGFVSVWVSFIPAYVSTKGKYMVAVEIFAILSSTYGLLCCIFMPKCYIIWFRPDMNSKDYISDSYK